MATFRQDTLAPAAGMGMSTTDLVVPDMPEGPGAMVGNAQLVLTQVQMQRWYDARAIAGGAFMTPSTREALQARVADPFQGPPESPAMAARDLGEGVQPLDDGTRQGATMVKFPGVQFGGKITVVAAPGTPFGFSSDF